MPLGSQLNEVLRAFGLEPESGAHVETRGRVILIDEYVFKPASDSVETQWVCDVLDRLPPSPNFRIPRPVRASTGDWIAEGFSCQVRLQGEHDMTRWDDVLRVSDAFHVALRDVQEPAWMRESSAFYQRCDRFAWDEDQLDTDNRAAQTIDKLRHFVRPSFLQKQLIHGDLAGNILFESGQSPAVIDFTPYWRPALYASAIAVVDAISVRGARPESLITSFLERRDGAQMLLRAALFRAGTYGQTQFYDKYFAGFQTFANIFCGQLDLVQSQTL